MFRNGAHNPGRKIINLREVTQFLRSKSKKFKVFPGPMNLTMSKKYFSRAKVVIGVHGGAMYNHIFAPKDATIVEYLGMPKSAITMRLSDTIIWRMSQNCDQRFYRVREEREISSGNIRVNISKLENLLNSIERE